MTQNNLRPRDSFFWNMGECIHKHPWVIIGIGVVLVALAVIGAMRLELKMTWFDIIPDASSSMQEFKRLSKIYGSFQQMTIGIEGEDKKEIRAVAAELCNRLSAEKQWFKYCEWRNEGGFYSHHLLMMMKTNDAHRFFRINKNMNFAEYLKNINDDFEREYSGNEDAVSDDEYQLVTVLNELSDIFSRIAHPATTINRAELQQDIRDCVIGPMEYWSQDRSMLIMFAQPVITMNDMDATINMMRGFDKIRAEVLKHYPGVRIRATGMHPLARDEMETSETDMIGLTPFAFLVILILFLLTYRKVYAPLLAGATLIISVILALGLLGLTIGQLNIMTAFCSIILIGLGVDFSIHIISLYSEFRFGNYREDEIIPRTLMTVGPGLITGGGTTALAFATLMLLRFKMMEEFGFAMASGILITLIVSMTILPAMLSLFGKGMRQRKGTTIKPIDVRFKKLEDFGRYIKKHAAIIIVICFGITVVLGYFGSRVGFDTDFLNIEDQSLDAVQLQRQIERDFSVSPQNISVSLTNYNEMVALTRTLDDEPNVGMVSSLALMLPSTEEQKRRIPVVRKLQQQFQTMSWQETGTKNEMIHQIQRFEMNIRDVRQLAVISGLDRIVAVCNRYLENETNTEGVNLLQASVQGINAASEKWMFDFRKTFFATGKELLIRSAAPTRITLNDVPQSVKEQFISKDGNEYLINCYAKRSIFEDMYNNPFINTVRGLAENVTGMAPLMQDLLIVARAEGAKAVLLALVLVTLLLIIDFRNLLQVMIAIVPLVAGTVSMLGTMVFLGLQFNMVTVLVVPVIIGIGIDDGVHIAHRYLKEGIGSMPNVLASTGRAVIMTTATTALGFGALAVAKFQGIAEMGIILCEGVVWCLFNSLIFVPALTIFAVEKWGMNLHPVLFCKNKKALNNDTK